MGHIEYWDRENIGTTLATGLITRVGSLAYCLQDPYFQN
jgi:hypothetical protein